MSKTRRLKIRKRWIVLAIVLLALNFYYLPYYYSQPGQAVILDEIIKVDHGVDKEGSFMLTTVRMGKANLFFYMWLTSALSRPAS